MAVEFNDFSIEVKDAMSDAITAFLHEAGGEMVSAVRRNIDKAGRNDTGQTKGAWKYIVDDNECIVGNPLENSIWDEFGTGEHAAKGNGRKGGWWIRVGSGKGEIPLSQAKKYKWEKVQEKDGQLVAVFTRGKTPTRALETAFNTKKSAIIKMAEQKFKEGLS